MMKPERFAHYDVAKELAQTATERKLFYEYERLESYIEQQEKYRLEAYQRIEDLNAEIERLKDKLKHGYKMCISCDTIYWSNERCPECFPL